MENHQERRNSRRYQAKLFVQAEFAGLPGTLGGRTHNISSRGAYFFIPRTEQIQVGGKVSLEILFPENFAFPGGTSGGGTFRIRASGTVVRLLHDGEMDVTRVAVSFNWHRLVRDDSGQDSPSKAAAEPSSIFPCG